MAIQTPFHSKGLRLPHQRHAVNPTVTGFAADSFVNVDAVIEVNKVCDVVNPRPHDGPVVAKARTHRLERCTVGPDLLVAVHTHLCRRNTGKGGLLNPSVAITAVDAQPRHVMFVAERDRLITNDVLLGHVRRANDATPNQRHRYDDYQAAEDRESRDCIR